MRLEELLHRRKSARAAVDAAALAASTMTLQARRRMRKDEADRAVFTIWTANQSMAADWPSFLVCKAPLSMPDVVAALCIFRRRLQTSAHDAAS